MYDSLTYILIALFIDFYQCKYNDVINYKSKANSISPLDRLVTLAWMYMAVLIRFEGFYKTNFC